MGRERQGHRGEEGPVMGNPPRVRHGPGRRTRSEKGGGSQSREMQQTQARGAGCRDERQILAGGGCRQCPGEKRWVAGANERVIQ